MHQAGAAVLKELLQKSRNEVAREVACPCGQQARFHEMRPKQILTVLGRIYMQRAYYVCGHCHDGQSPLDCELDIVGTECSPGVRRMMALVGSDGPFEHGRRQIEELAGLDVTSKTIERHSEGIGEDIIRREEAEVQRAIQLDLPEVHVADIPMMYVEMDGTGVPVVASETEGRVGKIEGQSARTREAKLGCVFTQTATDDQGRPIRDEDSTTYTGAIETAELFGRRLYAEAHHRGWNRAKRKVVIGDGAIWIWNIADEHFPTAIQIVDLYHARQHLWELSGKLFSSDPQQRLRWVKQVQKKLDAGKIESLVKTLHAFPPSTDELAKLLTTEAEYFARNAAYAIPQIPCRSPVHRLWCHRGRLQNCHRIAIETIWNVLDRPRSQLHPRPPMQPAEPQIRGLLGIPAGRMTHFTNMSHTHLCLPPCFVCQFVVATFPCESAHANEEIAERLRNSG